MAYVALVVLVVFLVLFYAAIVRGRGRIVARHGMSIGADLNTLAGKPRVRVQSVFREGPGRVRLVLTPEPPPDGDVQSEPLDLVVALEEGDFGLDVLREWNKSGAVIAAVIPPDSHIVRLRSLDDLQPLTLRRADDG